MIVGAANDSFDNRPVTAVEKARRFNQKPAIIAVNAVNADEVVQGLDRRLFEMGRVAAVASNEHAPGLRDAGLVVLVAGGADGAEISLAAEQERLDSLIADMQAAWIIWRGCSGW